MAQPSPVPVRYPSGVSTDFKWGPLADFGRPNPFGYHFFQDDFDILNPTYVATKTGAGTLTGVAGGGGFLLATTAALATDNVVLNLPFAGFQLTQGKKAFYLTRFQLSSASNAGFICGLINTTTTPFTGGQITDGIWISKVTGSLTNLNINYALASVVTTVALPTGAYTLANATNLDMGFYVDRFGNINAFIGAQLVGWLPQSGVGALFGGRGVVAAIAPATLTAVNLNPTIGILSGTAAASTMTIDFEMAAQER